MCSFIEMDDKEIINFLTDPQSQSVSTGSVTEKCIIKTLLDTILKKEDFVNLLIRWKVESMQTLIRIMKEICTNELPKEACKDFFLENIVAPMMSLETEKRTRDNLIELALALCPLVPVTDLSQNEYQIYLQDIYSKYIPAISQLRDSNYAKWHKLWIFLVKFCAKKIHESMDLTNRLLRIVEYAFRNSSYEQRLKGYDCWKELIDNASLDPNHICTPKQIKLLITPLRAKFSKQEVVICKRFDVFVYLLEKLQRQAVLCLPEFLEFCFGPVGDSKDPSRSGQAKSAPQIWGKSAKVLIGILGHGHDRGAECVLEEIRFDKPLVDGDNIDKFYKVLLNSVAECSVLLKDDNMENKRKKAIIKCMWKSLFNLIMRAPESERDQHFLLIADILDTYLQQSKGHPYFEDLLRLIFLSLLSLENDDLDNRIPIMLKQLIIIFISIDVGPSDIFKQVVTQSFSKVLLEEKKLRMMQTVMDCLSIEHVEDRNITNYGKIWLLLANELGIACDPAKFVEFPKFDEFFEWPSRNLNRLEDANKKQVVLYWMKLYRKVTLDDESKKISIMKDLEKSFKNNPLSAPNVSSLLNVISQFETKFSAEFVIKLMNVVSLILQLPNLQAEDENKLSSLVMQYFEPSLACYKSDAVDELIRVLSVCIERSLSIHSGLKLVDPLVAFIKVCPEKLHVAFAKHLKDPFAELYKNETDNDNANGARELLKVVSVFNKNVEDEKRTFVIPSGRSARIAHMCKNSPTSPHKAGKIRTNFSLFGSDPETMSPLRIKSDSPAARKKKGANVVEVTIGTARSVNEENSTDFIPIDTEVELRVEKLSEHQKEVLKKRRDDIPALYEDLTQSISQDMFKSNSTDFIPATTSETEVREAENGDEKAVDSTSGGWFGDSEEQMIGVQSSSDKFDGLPPSRHSLPAANDICENVAWKSSLGRKSLSSIQSDDDNPVEKRKRREIERLKMDIVGADMFYESPRRTRVRKPTKKEEEEALKKDQSKPSTDGQQEKSVPNSPKKSVVRPSKAKKADSQDAVKDSTKEINKTLKIPKDLAKEINKNLSEARMRRPSKAKKAEELAKEINETPKTPTQSSEVRLGRSSKAKKAENGDQSQELVKKINKTPKPAEVRVRRPKKKKLDEDKPTEETGVTDQHDHPNLTPESPSRKRRRSKAKKSAAAAEETQNTVIELKPKSPEKDSSKLTDDRTPNNEIQIKDADKKAMNINNINIKLKFDNKTRSAKIIDQLDSSIVHKRKYKRRKTKQDEGDVEKTMETEAPKELPLETPKHPNAGIGQKNLQTLLDADSVILQTQVKNGEEQSEDIIESSQESFAEIVPLLNSSKKRSSRIEETVTEDVKPEDETVLIQDYLVQLPDEIASGVNLDVFHSHDSTLTQDNSVDAEETLSRISSTETFPQAAIETFPQAPTEISLKSPDPPKRPSLTESELIMCQMDTMSICGSKDSAQSEEIDLQPLNSVEDILATTTSTDTAPSTAPCTPLRSQSLPSSPITADTPNRTSELLDNTVDISPISSKSDFETDVVVPTAKPIQIDFGKEDGEQSPQISAAEPMEEIRGLVAKVKDFVDDDKDDSFEDGCASSEADDVTSDSAGSFRFDFSEPVRRSDEHPIQNGRLGLSFGNAAFRGFKESPSVPERLSKLHNFVHSMANKPFIKRKAGTTSSPSAMRIKKLFVNMGAKQPDHQEAAENFNESDILTFSREIPSPLAVPASSILKRKWSDSSDAEGMSPCAKRKRVNFSDPCLTSKKIFIKDDYQPSLEAKRLFDSAPERMTTDDRLKDIFDCPDESPSSELSTETDSDVPETEPSLTVVNAMMLHKNKPVFPKLVDCKDDVSVIVKRITSPMFVPALMNKLKGKNIKTVGDLAELSEAEVNRFPFKVPVVANVLKALENYHRKNGGSDFTALESEHCGDDDKRNGDVEMPKLDVKLELKMLIKRALREKVPTDDLAKILLPHVDNVKLYPLIKSQCPSVALDTLEEKDYTAILKTIIDSKGISEILKRAHVDFHKAEKEHDFYQAIADYVKYTVPLEKFFRGRSVEDLEVGIEESIKNKVFQKGEIIENCLLPLVETPDDIAPYLNALTAVDLEKIVLGRADREDPRAFIERLVQSYGSAEAKAIAESLWCRQVDSPLELVACFAKKLDAQPEPNRTESLVEMFKFISDKLDRKTLLDLHVVFLGRIAGSLDK